VTTTSATVLEHGNPKRQFMIAFVNDYMSRFDSGADAWEQLVDTVTDLLHLYLETRIDDDAALGVGLLDEVETALSQAVEHLLAETPFDLSNEGDT
jgi:hypothetical protein